MARKNAQQLFKEHLDLTVKLTALETRIENRAKQLVKQQPDAIYSGDITVEQMLEDECPFMDREDKVMCHIDIIKSVEDHNLKSSRIVQRTIHDEIKDQES